MPGEVRRDRSYLRLLLTILATSTFFYGYVAASSSVALSDIAGAFGFTSSDDDALVRAIALVGLGSFAAVALAPLADRLGRKPFLIWSTLAAAAFSALSGVAGALTLFAAFQFAARAAAVSAYAASVSVVAEEFPPDQRGWATGVITGTGALGLVGVSLLRPPMNALFSWRGLFLISIAGALIAGWIRGSVVETGRWRSLRRRGVARAIGRMGFRAELVQMGVVFFLSNFAILGAGTWWGLYASRERDLTAGAVGGGLAAAYLAGVLGHFVAGRIQDSMGRRRVATMFLLAGAVLGVGAFQAREPVTMIAAVAAAGFFALGSSAPLTALAAELFPTEARTTSVAAVRSGFGTLGAILGPLTVGTLAREQVMGGIAESGLLVLVVFLLPAVIVLQYLPETKTRELESIVAATEAVTDAFAKRVTEPAPSQVTVRNPEERPPGEGRPPRAP